MSGSIAALSAFNESGTQGTAVVENIDPKAEGDTLSVIYNRNDTTRQLITGTSLVEVTELGVPHPSGLNNQLGTYVVNSDVDVIGELYLTMDIEKEFKVSESSMNDAKGQPGQQGDVAGIINNLPSFLGFEDFLVLGSDYTFTPFIKRIEICVGTQVFQKITPADINTWAQIRGIQAAEMISFLSPKISGRTRPPTATFGADFLERKDDVQVASWKIGFHIPTLMDTILPNFSNFTDQKNNGYIMAAAPHQDMNIKIYFGDGVLNKNISMAAEPDNQGPLSLERKTFSITSASLTMKHTTLSNHERLLIRDNPFSKRVSFLQTVESQPYVHALGNPSYAPGWVAGAGAPFEPIAPIMPPLTIDVNCDSFNIFASGLYIQRSNIPFVESSSNDEAGQILNYGDRPTSTVELLLNGNSFTREIDIETLIYCKTQNIATSPAVQQGYGGVAGSSGVYGFYLPLANTVYGSGVPMNRFDNITVRIRYQFPFGLFANTFTYPGAGAVPWYTSWQPKPIEFKYAVTCVGETSILYNGGASSITRF